MRVRVAVQEKQESRSRISTKSIQGGEKDTDQTGAVSGRVADLATSEDGQLALHARSSGGVGCNDVQRADTLAIQPSVLREALSNIKSVS